VEFFLKAQDSQVLFLSIGENCGLYPVPEVMPATFAPSKKILASRDVLTATQEL